MKNTLFKKLSQLETIEEKSFWVVALSVLIVGIAGLLTAASYSSIVPMLIAAIMCTIIPILLMLLVYKYDNYHYAYPILCICIGGICIPFTFIFGGGFFSGMPLFCASFCGICALCYIKKWRYISLACCILGNAIAFSFVWKFGSPFPIIGTNNIYYDIVFCAFFTAVCLFISVNFIIDEVRKYRINDDIFQHYLDIGVRRELIKKANNGTLSEQSEYKKVVILFADISHFTATTEKMSPEMAADYLNIFLTTAEKHIHKTGGIIDKYIGDCVMAYWFHSEKENNVLKAVQTVIDIKDDLYSQSEDLFQKFGTELNFSSGIAYGDVIFGNIGSEMRRDYTIIGDAVNTASRIENYAHSGEILISDEAAAMIQDNAVLENVEDNIYFKGKNHAIHLYRVVSLNDSQQKAAEKLVFDPKQYSLYVCGCRGSFPVSGLRFSEFGGETSCYILKKDNYAVVIDCGTGLKNARPILKDCTKIDILLTHVHYDHILGFLTPTFPENVPIRIFGHFSGWNYPNSPANFMDHPYWPIGITPMERVEINLGDPIQLDKGIEATFFRSDHPDGGCVVQLLCNKKKICIFADCENAYTLNPDIAENSDILFYDGMFDDNDIIDHTGWGHSTWQEGIRFGTKYNIKKLVITHHNPENGDQTLLKKELEARDLLKNVSFARTGDQIQI